MKKKNILMQVSSRFFSRFPPNFKSNGMTSHQNSMAAKYSFKMVASEVASFETHFFRIAGTSEAETLMEGKT